MFYRRALLAAAFLALALFFQNACAHAAQEACAAEVRVGAVGVHGIAPLGPARRFAFQLSAQKDRVVSGTLALDTDRGWFVAPFRNVHIAAVQRHYDWVTGQVTKTVWESDVLYVDVNQDVTVNHYLLDDVATTDTRAPIFPRCYSPYYFQAPDPKMQRAFVGQPDVRPLDEPDLTVAPAANATIIAARASAPVVSSTCAEPFKYASVTSAVTPDIPDSVHYSGRDRSATRVMVLIDMTGNATDAWVDQSSGVAQFDDNVVRAAQQSTFTPAIAYCRAIPSYYIYMANFAS